MPYQQSAWGLSCYSYVEKKKKKKIKQIFSKTCQKYKRLLVKSLLLISISFLI